MLMFYLIIDIIYLYINIYELNTNDRFNLKDFQINNIYKTLFFKYIISNI